MAYRNKTARQNNFATVPRADIPRSTYSMRQTRKQAFDASDLIPIFCEEVLPEDVWQHTESIMARFATPIAPAIDDIQLETFYFFEPNRVGWDATETQGNNLWEDLITGRVPNELTPTIGPPNNGSGEYIIPVGSVADHFGLPPGEYTTQFLVNAFPFYAYFDIYNQWFRDQNLQQEWTIPTAGPWNTFLQGATAWNGMPLRANKRSDYFTRSLPWPQKGDPVQLPLGTTAPVISNGIPPTFEAADTGWPGPAVRSSLAAYDGEVAAVWALGAPSQVSPVPTPITFSNQSGLVADLAAATAATINAIRIAFQTQKLLERDARGGSRYVEQILSQFGIRSPDYRLDRPEYLGGSSIPVNVNPIAQTAAYDAEPSDAASPVGNLGAEMHARGHKRTFSYAATEHGYIIGLAVVRATPTYQQGIRRHWLHTGRLSYYFPVFGHLGEQAVNTLEIYAPLNLNPANPFWGYQERWAELRYTPNEITGVLRSQAPQPMDWWHYAEEFANEPALNAQFITDKTKETLARSLATAPSAQWSAQIIMDILHEAKVARLMPLYGDPGLIDHF